MCTGQSKSKPEVSVEAAMTGASIVAASAEAGVWAIESESGRVRLNADAARVLGAAGPGMYTLAQFARLVHDEDCESLIDAFEHSGVGSPVRVVTRLSDSRPVVWRGAWSEAAGAVVGLCWESGVGDDAVSEAIAARLDAEAANEAKTRFLAELSHEIRTPLTAILGFASALSEIGGESGAQAETIRRNGEHLLALMDTVMDLSRIESDRLELELVRVNPIDLAGEVVDSLMQRATDKGLSLRLARGAKVPESVMADPVRLRQIISNLVSNAVKFTDRGEVTVRLAGSCDNRLLVEVEDTGPGLEPEASACLFRAFARVQGEKREGTGLGLAISKRLAEAMNGRLRLARSTPGVGSVFELSVPVSPPGGEAEPTGGGDEAGIGPDASGAGAGEATGEALSSVSGAALDGLRILLAEDSVDTQRLLVYLLKRAGAEVVTVGAGDAALAEVGKQSFDLIIMDMQMPVMDGYDAVRALRASGNTTPVAALTAHAMNDDRERCLQAGCDEYETKPIDRARLIEMCLRCVGPR